MGLLTLQGGFLPGDEEHRMLTLRTKDLVETLGGCMAYVPVQSRHSPLPDVIAMPVKGRMGYRLFAEIEFSTANDTKAIEMKLSRAWGQDAVPLLVFSKGLPQQPATTDIGKRRSYCCSMKMM
jgi:hypothetical protein